MYFYEKHQFVSVKEIPGMAHTAFITAECILYNDVALIGFYRIKGVDYTAYTYAKFLNAGYPTISLRLYTSLRFPDVVYYFCMWILERIFIL